MMRSKIKGYFMLFRILPVMVWSLTGTIIGTALAAFAGHEINWPAFLLVLATSALIQGYPTHIINEIYDWKSGADRRELSGQKSGGSKVLQARLLTVRDMWHVFFVSHFVLVLLLGACIWLINLKIVYVFIIPGYLSGLLYSLPPFRFSYRPFLGEWLGGFAGIFLLVSGSYYAQSLTINAFSALIAIGMGLTYIGIMTFFHYLDFEHDQLATPIKNTTVVSLGLAGSRKYAYGCLLFSIIVFLFYILKSGMQGLPLLFLALAVLVSHNRTDLKNDLSIIKWGKIITFSTLLAGITFAAFSNPIFSLMILPIFAGFWVHKKFGKLTGINLRAS